MPSLASMLFGAPARRPTGYNHNDRERSSGHGTGPTMAMDETPTPSTKIVRDYRELRTPYLQKRTEALALLHHIASLVAPIMRAHNWRIPLLEELALDTSRLLGYHEFAYDRSVKICIRLRSQRNPSTAFGELEDIVDALLHELAHFDEKQHDDAFRELWHELRDDYEALYPRAKKLPRSTACGE
ncbi:hypothetical protein LTR36_002426 [Oleoguttula mirabilis]|uniref:WLM domain-containing protein n=1 Tax=Oleoguttula mirabilis TaxID=1507867 RepID=A0AAV9JKW4_9PEZI|nr:hypothetical protein LTR36_002426 [Oleoguttula mirabilis]